MIKVYRTGTQTGADHWYANVAKLLKCELITGGSIPVCDNLILPSVLAGKAKKYATNVVAAVHRNEAPNPDADRIIFCSEWLQKKYPTRQPSMVFRPMNRLPETLPHERTPSRMLGAINANHNKGYNFLNGYPGQLTVLNRGNIKGATLMPGYQHPQAFYDSIGIFILPSISEGYSTVCLEALGQSIPVIATDIPGIREVCGDAAHYIYSATEIMQVVAKIYNRYEYYSHMAWDRYNEIKGLNSIEQLITFTL
jgi:glycosyltransferase involved in cell wall biosynthesis